jgi:hypothetical protein
MGEIVAHMIYDGCLQILGNLRPANPLASSHIRYPI